MSMYRSLPKQGRQFIIKLQGQIPSLDLSTQLLLLLLLGLSMLKCCFHALCIATHLSSRSRGRHWPVIYVSKKGQGVWWAHLSAREKTLNESKWTGPGTCAFHCNPAPGQVTLAFRLQISMQLKQSQKVCQWLSFPPGSFTIEMIFATTFFFIYIYNPSELKS